MNVIFNYAYECDQCEEEWVSAQPNMIFCASCGSGEIRHVKSMLVDVKPPLLKFVQQHYSGDLKECHVCHIRHKDSELMRERDQVNRIIRIICIYCITLELRGITRSNLCHGQ